VLSALPGRQELAQTLADGLRRAVRGVHEPRPNGVDGPRGVRYRDKPGTVYQFTSNTSATVQVRNATVGTIPTRTCRSTHAAEKQILSGVDTISRR
jgi:hypothetical protein